MRIITEKDKRGLLIAFRTFIRPFTGERVSQVAGNAIIERVLESGVTFDALLNKENWGRAKEVIPSLTASDYVDLLAENKIEVKKITDEPGWYEPENGIDLITEAAHDFFMEVSGKGGKWNIPSAKANLAKAIKTYSLEAILSEDLIKQVCDDPETTFFLYIQAILSDFNSLTIVTEPTEAEAAREKELAELEALDEQTAEETPEEEVVQVEDPEQGSPRTFEDPDQDFGEGLNVGVAVYNDDNEEHSPFPIRNSVIVGPDPHKMKVDAIKFYIFAYSPTELQSLFSAVITKDGSDPLTLTLEDLINAIADGELDPKKENVDAKNIHTLLNADLTQAFIDCARANNVEMNDKLAAKYDVLCDSWDLRDAKTRKFYKLQNLINSAGNDDLDLQDALKDMERFYLGEDE